MTFCVIRESLANALRLGLRRPSAALSAGQFRALMRLPANPFHVRQILRAAGGQFVSHEQVLADDPDRQAVEVRFNFGFPRFLEGNCRDGSQQVNPVGRAA